jgi:hypothetical protein
LLGTECVLANCLSTIPSMSSFSSIVTQLTINYSMSLPNPASFGLPATQPMTLLLRKRSTAPARRTSMMQSPQQRLRSREVGARWPAPSAKK